MPEPASGDRLPYYPMISQSVFRRTVEKDLATNITRYSIHEDAGLAVHPQNRIQFQEIRRETWQVERTDPVSLTARTHMTAVRSRDSWDTRTETKQSLCVDERHYFIEAELVAYEGSVQVLH